MSDVITPIAVGFHATIGQLATNGHERNGSRAPYIYRFAGELVLIDRKAQLSYSLAFGNSDDCIWFENENNRLEIL